MISRKKRLEACRLYLILDAQVCDHARLLEVMKVAVNNGVDIVQLRDKLGTVQRVMDFTKRAQSYLKGRVPFIMNDRADLAELAGASGVHVGQDDLSPSQVRHICGPSVVVGRSCQNVSHLLTAQREGVDYVGFGSVFKTLTKPGRSPMDLDMLKKVVRCAQVPVFAIGGITRENIGMVRACGVTRVAVCREILLAKDPARVTKELKQLLVSDGDGPIIENMRE